MNELWVLFLQVFDMTFFGMTTSHILGGSIVLLLFIVLRKLFAKTVVAYLTKMAKKTKNEYDDQVLEAITEPIKLVPIVFGIFFLTQWFALPVDIVTMLLNLTKSMIAFALFWAVYNLLEPFTVLLESVLTKITADNETLYAEEFTGLIVKGLRITVVGVGGIIVLSQWGVDVMPVLGGLGIMGMAFAFGAQDSIANIFGGVKILLDGQFKRGDWIKTPDIEGTVMEIGIATTKVREFDKAVTSIPNKQLSDATIKNYSKMTNRRVKMTLGLEYSSTANQLENVVDRIKEYLQNNPTVAQPGIDKVVQMVHLVNFAGSSIDISLYYFTKTIKWTEWRENVQDDMLAFKRIVEKEGAAFAFPSQSMYLESTPTKPKSVEDVPRLAYVGKKNVAQAGDDEEGDGDG